MTQAIATRTPPTETTSRELWRSTNHDLMGTSQVSATTKIVKATWMATRPQWCLASIGPTNSVQPYCRLAIIAMQRMPMASWSHGWANGPLFTPDNERASTTSDISNPAGGYVRLLRSPMPKVAHVPARRDKHITYTSV